MTIHAQLAVVIVAWILGLACSALAIVFAVLDPLRRFGLSLILAGIAMVLGYLGFGHGTPFSFIPQIGYTWSSGDVQISLRSSWFFLAPLVLGTAAIVVAIGTRKRLSHSG
jgi:hypothetical protein